MPPALAALLGALVTALVMGVIWLVIRGRAESMILTPTVSEDARRIAEGVPVGALVVGPKDEVLVTNEVALSDGLAKGSRVTSPELLQIVRTVRASQERHRGPIKSPRAGALQHVELDAAVIPLADGFVLALADDRTATQRVETVRRDFVANVSHELKTPIGAIGILAEAIEAAADDSEAVARFTGRLQNESRRLGELLSQIIELSRLQSADNLVVHEAVEIDDVIDEALGRSQAAAAKREVNLVRVPSPAVQVLGDQWQLIDAVTNLLQNAIAYSDPRARVAVTVVLTEADGEEFVEIKVADNGIGIKPEDQERIFERFYRVDYGRSRDNGGTGLGLSIVRHIALSHQGSVRVWSRPHQGSTFTIRLPRHIAEGGAFDDQDPDN